jgi:hypothetical protein
MEENLPENAANPPYGDPLKVCEHFDLLGVSAAIRPDSEASDLIHCMICNLSFHLAVEGQSLVVTEVHPYSPGQ